MLNSNVTLRVRELIRQGCYTRGVNILQGSVIEEMIRNYIANQGGDEKDENFKIEGRF